MTPGSEPSETFGTASRRLSAGPASGSDEQLAVADELGRRRRSGSGFMTTQSRWTGPGSGRRSPPRRRRRRGRSRAASRPRARCRSARPSRSCRRRARRSSRPSSLSAVSSSTSAAPSGPLASVSRPPSTVSVTGSAGMPTPAIVPSTTSVPSQARSSGEMKPSPHGRFPKAPRAVSSPASGIAVRPSSPSRRSLPLAQVIRASLPAFEDVGDRVAAAAQLGHVGAHHPGEHLLGDAGQGRDPRARLRRRLARGGVGERLDGRSEDDVGLPHRGGDRRAAARRRG